MRIKRIGQAQWLCFRPASGSWRWQINSIEAGDVAGAERALGSLMGANPDAQLLAAMGNGKLRQNQLREAENPFARLPRHRPPKSRCMP